MTTNTEGTGKAPRTCECGCGATVVRRFAVGHDAKLKSQLIKTILAGEAPNTNREAKVAGRDAAKRLAALGWAAHLERSRVVRQAKASRARKAPTPAESTTKDNPMSIPTVNDNPTA
ncbi:hypothetical protein [Frankia sp. CiP3]|uniref:hypothetical protein n=1 Tax=Frankia sp. CiP3 TaxID=2880971 RepID=UPI001EF49469|nr:hypothetical protein [Frankia sp. CiP3]